MTPAKPPGDVLRALSTGLGDFIASSDPLWPLLLNKSTPLEALSLQLKALADFVHKQPDDVLKEYVTIPSDWVKSTGWRFMVVEGDQYGACHVGSIQAGDAPKLTGFSKDELVLKAMECFNGLDDLLAEVDNLDSYTPSVLRIPWLHLEAFWLRYTLDSASAAYPDYIVPYAGFLETPGKDGKRNEYVDDTPVQFNDNSDHLEKYLAGEFLVKIQPAVQLVYANAKQATSEIQEARSKQLAALAARQKTRATSLETQAGSLQTNANKEKVEAARVKARLQAPATRSTLPTDSTGSTDPAGSTGATRREDKESAPGDEKKET